MGRSKHCCEIQRNLIKKLINEGKKYKEVQNIIGCSAKMISNALKWTSKEKTCGRKRATSEKIDRRIAKLVKKTPTMPAATVKAVQ